MRSSAHLFPFRLGRHRRRLPSMAGASSRIAQVSLPGSLFERASYFSSDDLKALEEFRPQTLIGSATQILSLADRVSSRESRLATLECAVFVLTDFRAMPLNERDRTALWNAFSVPVYELLLGDDGVLLAAECQAQEGWHIEAGVRFSSVNAQLWYSHRGRQTGTGLIGTVDDEPCPCGKAGKRIINVAMDYRDPVRERFAYSSIELSAVG